MKRFTDAGRAAIDAGNLYAGLSLALMIPDICASLEDPGPGKSKERHVRWFRDWAEPKFTSRLGSGMRHVFISAEDCYRLRCSVVHSGQSYIDDQNTKGLNRFEFFDETVGAHLNWFQLNFADGRCAEGFLQLKASSFSRTMFEIANEWDSAKANDAAVQQQKAKLLLVHSKGARLGGGAVLFS